MIYCENIVNVTLFFLLSLDLGTTFFPPFSAMPLPQLLQIFFFPISTMALPQLVCQKNFFFPFYFGHSIHTSHLGSRIGQRNFGIHVAEIQHFLSPPFSSSLSYFWLNFDNGDTEIQSLSSESQITFNSSYNAN